MLNEFVDDDAYRLSSSLCAAPELAIVGVAEVDGDAGHFNIHLKGTLCPHKIADGELARLLHICSLLHAVIIQSADVLLVQYVTLTEDSRMHATEKRAAGATAKSEVKGELVEFSWWLKKQGYAESTIRQYSKNIKILAERGANLYDPDSTKDVIARQEWSNARRSVVIASYTAFLHKHGESWEPPKCRVTRKLPFIPTEQEIDSLIAASGKKTATLLQLLKETAMRGGETDKLKWINIDTENRTVTLNTPEKNSLPRIFKVSNKLLGMLNSLPKRTEYVFGGRTAKSRRATFYRTRQQAAKKLQNPRLLRITFHTLRHWKATTLYHQTKDILYVKNFLGHRKIENTLLYIQVAEVIFKETTDEFTVRVAQGPKEIKELLEVGFAFVCEKDGLMFFRKRK